MSGERSTHEDGQRADRELAQTGSAHPYRWLPAPEQVIAEPGVGQVTLRWAPIPGAAGYLIYRANAPDGPFTPLDHGGADVLAVPSPVFADTSGTPGQTYWYAVAAVPGWRLPPGERSTAIPAMPLAEGTATVRLWVDAGRPAGQIDPVWRMLGSEHLSQMFYGLGPGGFPIGLDFQAALAVARDQLGTRMIRAHAILHDELGIYREVEGSPHYDFSGVDRIFDRLRDLGLRPVVELSFMPHDLAANPDATVFEYRAIVSPPRDWSRWAELIRRLTGHLVERYGIGEVRQWCFEVWNEPNLKVFWTGTQADYFQLYELTAHAIKQVDPTLKVGGPATAAAGWINEFLEFARRTGVPVDFISTHTYGNLPLNIRETARTYGWDNLAIYWTEWGVSSTHFKMINDSVFGAPFILHGLKHAQRRIDALAYWVVSDQFEELGRPQRLFHGGFGLLTVGNLRKPRFWAIALAEQLGQNAVSIELDGDGAGSLVDAWASRQANGALQVLAWNGTLNHAAYLGNPLLTRRLQIHITGLDAARYRPWLARVDETHSNILAHWSGSDWPTPEEWEQLRAADRLDEQPLPEVMPRDRTVEFDLMLPMPGIVRLRLEPA